MEKERVAYSLPVQTNKTYINPVNVSNYSASNGFMANPDPYVLKYNGEYFCYSTSNKGVPVLHSKDMVNWEYKGLALETAGHRNFWAPAVIYHNGLFYMYYSCMLENDTDVHFQFMKVATSKSPLGPFEYKKTLFDNFSIDARVVQDDSGDFYLFYSPNDYVGIDAERPGTVIMADRLIDMVTLEGKPQLVVKPTIDQEIYERNRFKDGRDWHTIEGGFYLTHRDKSYVMYSGNAFTHEDYFVGISIADHTGNTKSIKNKLWSKYPDQFTYSPIIRRNEVVEGTGHNSVVKAPNNIDEWIVYHGRNVQKSADTKGERRQMRIDPVLWMGDKMWVPGPSYTKQDAPAMPLFRELFDDTDTLDVNWILQSGEWKVSDGQACQSDRACVGAVLSKIKLKNFIYEANLKWQHFHMGGLYGVYAYYLDSFNNVQVLLDVGKRQLSIVTYTNGIKNTDIAVDMDKNFDFQSYHQLLITKTGALINVKLDGLDKASTYYEGDIGQFGLITYYTGAAFDGISVTDYIEMDRQNQKEFIKQLKVNKDSINAVESLWKSEDGALHYITKDKDSELLFTSDLKESYGFGVELIVKKGSVRGSAGIYAAYVDEKNYLKVTIDMKTKACIVQHKGMGYDDIISAPLPLDNDLSEPVCFYVSRKGSNMYVLVNDYIVFDENIDMMNAKVGLVSDVSARFEWLRLIQN